MGLRSACSEHKGGIQTSLNPKGLCQFPSPEGIAPFYLSQTSQEFTLPIPLGFTKDRSLLRSTWALFCVSSILLRAFFVCYFFAATFQKITFGATFPQMPSSRSRWWVPSLQHHPHDLHFWHEYRGVLTSESIRNGQTLPALQQLIVGPGTQHLKHNISAAVPWHIMA